MNHRKKLRTFALLALLLFGCASKPEIVRIDPPRPSAAPRKAVKVLLFTPEDNRAFNEDGGSPDRPALSSRFANRETVRGRAVGQKRNMYNEAEGALLLDKEDTVEEWVARMATDALSAAGYETFRDPLEAEKDAAGMRIGIEALWVWNEAAAFRSIIRGRIDLSVSFDTGDQTPRPIRIEARREIRVPGRHDWQEILTELHVAAVEQLTTLLSEHPPLPRTPDGPAPEAVDEATVPPAPAALEGDTETDLARTDADTDTDTEAEADTAAAP